MAELTNPTHEPLEVPLLGIVIAPGETRDLGDVDEDTASVLRDHGVLTVTGLPDPPPPEPPVTGEEPAEPSLAAAEPAETVLAPQPPTFAPPPAPEPFPGPATPPPAPLSAPETPGAV